MRALTIATAFPSSLLIVDAYTRYSMWIGLPKYRTSDIIEAITHFLVRTRSLGRVQRVNYIRTDAGSSFTSDPFAQWCRHHNIHLSIAAPHHQEMNSICERQWQTIHQTARVLLVHARLPIEYFHFAVLYAIAILNTQPAKGVILPDGTPTCPHTLAFTVKPKIGNFRVFGCPSHIKHYTTSTHKGSTIPEIKDDFLPTPRHIQRSVRGIFIGFPESQAGWLFYLPTPLGTHHFIVSRDVTFDESFESTLAHTQLPFKGAMPERPTPPLLTHLNVYETAPPPLESTGCVDDFPNRLPTPAEEGVHAPPDLDEETFQPEPPLPEPPLPEPTQETLPGIEPETPLDPDEISYESDDDELPTPTDDPDSTPTTEPPLPPRRSSRTNKGQRNNTFEQQFDSIYCMEHPLRAMVATIQTAEPQPMDLFLPEPNSLKAVLRLPPDYVYTKDNRPATDQAHREIQTKYKGLDFRSCLCTILYLAYSTRADILFIVCKLAKACTQPGLKDYEALIWLLGFLRKHPALGINFHANASTSPVNQLLRSHHIETSDLLAFSDASWQDCPDTGRSTVGHLIFYQGGLIAANSHVPLPVSMSSAEAEYMAACAACMTSAIIRSLLYDIRYLGTPEYDAYHDPVKFRPSILCVDNAATIAMSKSPKLTKKTRHIARHFHFVRDGSERQLHALVWIPNTSQLADVLTKTQALAKIQPMTSVFMYPLPSFLIAQSTKGDKPATATTTS